MAALPESPEGVALLLFAMLFERELREHNEATARWALDLFSECLRAANGERHGKPKLVVPEH